MGCFWLDGVDSTVTELFVEPLACTAPVPCYSGFVPFQSHQLYADVFGAAALAHALCIHGGGVRGGQSYQSLRQWLLQQGVGSTAVDCIGHGRTGGAWSDSSLQGREQQIAAVLQHLKITPSVLIGTSMGAYNAIRLAQQWQVQQLVLIVPGIYAPQALQVPLGPAFSSIIRQHRSWEASDAWDLLQRYTGRLLVIAAACDEVIPAEIPPRLVAAAHQAVHRQLLTVPQATHRDVLPWMPASQDALVAWNALLGTGPILE